MWHPLGARVWKCFSKTRAWQWVIFPGTGDPRFRGSGEAWNRGKELKQCLSWLETCASLAAMPQKAVRKSTRKRHPKRIGLTTDVPAPPIEEASEDLSVEIRKAVGWRLKMALFQLEVEGERTTKKAFVEQALISALDRFDQNRKRNG